MPTAALEESWAWHSKQMPVTRYGTSACLTGARYRASCHPCPLRIWLPPLSVAWHWLLWDTGSRGRFPAPLWVPPRCPGRGIPVKDCWTSPASSAWGSQQNSDSEEGLQWRQVESHDLRHLLSPGELSCSSGACRCWVSLVPALASPTARSCFWGCPQAGETSFPPPPSGLKHQRNKGIVQNQKEAFLDSAGPDGESESRFHFPALLPGSCPPLTCHRRLSGSEHPCP